MKCTLSWTALVFAICGSLGSCEAWAQTGNPTALPPGGANQPTAARAPSTSQPAGRPVTTQPARAPGTTSPTRAPTPTQRSNMAAQLGQGFDAGQNQPRLGDRFSTPSNFGGGPAVIGRSPTTGGTGTRPGSALPGGPNFSGGSTSATLRPAGPIAGGPNAGNPGFVPSNSPVGGTPTGDAAFMDGVVNGFRGVVNAPLTPIVPNTVTNVTVAPQAPVVNLGTIDAVAPQPSNIPASAIVVEAQSSNQPAVPRNDSATGVQPLVEPQSVATATAFPERRANVAADATVSASRRSQATGERPRNTGFRGNTNGGQRGDVAYVSGGYTVWQGYYWHHNPSSGWQYWNGSQWTRF